MVEKLKIYLDTSVISALFDERNPERRALTELFFKDLDKYDIYISEIVVTEIEKTPDKILKDKMAEFSSRFSIIDVMDEVERLADEYISQQAIPGQYPEDAYHIALAVLNQMDYLLSWNFKHVVRRKTRDIVRMVNTLHGVRQIEIMTPAELL